ncbi:MAG: lysozyme inhibitor LprI family protein [Thermomonas sp.]
MKALHLLLLSIGLTIVIDASAAERWPLAYRDQSSNQFIWDKRTPRLVRTVVPHQFVPELLAGLGGPPDPVYVTSDRYFSASACVQHACPSKSFFWYDTNTGSGLGAILDAWEDGDLTLVSKTIDPKNIPNPAVSDLRRWLTDLGIRPKSVVFADAKGKKSSLIPADFAPAQSFVSPVARSSFNCSKAATVIEKQICTDSTLSKLDLELSDLVREIKLGHSTLPDRHQLLEFQREWLTHRDQQCKAEIDMEACLVTSYKQQYDALMNWKPKN